MTNRRIPYPEYRVTWDADGVIFQGDGKIISVVSYDLKCAEERRDELEAQGFTGVEIIQTRWGTYERV